MRLSTLSLVTFGVLPSLISALTVPAVVPRNETLIKRDQEINYLTFCVRANPDNMADAYHASYMAWYSDPSHATSRSRHPDDLSSEYRKWVNGQGDWLVWEEKQQNIYFPNSGVTVQTHIDSNAASRGYGEWAGWAQRTSDWKTFNCYK
ncbi:hypothetical protein FRB90_010507, partial [Tulasnella sp. 427]